MKCSGCEGKGKAEEWLEVEEQPFTRSARTTGDPRADALERAARQGTLAPAVRWRGTSTKDAPEAIRPLLARLEKTLPFNPKTDRVEAIDFELYESAVTTVSYELCRTVGTVDVQGWDGEILETPESREPLARWWRRMTAAMAAVSCAGLVLAGWYSFRHPFFLSTVNSGLLWALAPLLGLSVFRPVSLLALPRRAQSRAELVRWSGPTIAFLFFALVLAVTGNPSVAHATQLADTGRLGEALTEADACVVVGREPERAAFLYDNLRLRVARSATDPGNAWKKAQEKFFTPQARQAAERHALAVTAREVERDLGAESFGTAEARLALVPEHLKNHPKIRPLRFEAAARQAKVCIERIESRCAAMALGSLTQAGFTEEDLRPLRERADELGLPVLRETWRTITSSRVSLDERLGACAEIDAPLRFIESVGTGADSPVTRAKLDEICTDLRERQRLLEIRRQEREERAREARRRAWAYKPLLCNDGTFSPSCVCGQSSRRGCCSWHGGVDGCSAPYPD